MCTVNCILFGARNLHGEEIRDKKVLEVGSRDINGSLRSFVESRKPACYIGVDICKGPGVDVIGDAENLLDRFELDSFDLIISTELLEHLRNWRRVISNIKNVCKPGGIILITTRSIDYPLHGYPHDFWRYELEDMENIFSDCEMQVLERDPQKGVFIKAKKPLNFEEKDLSDYELYSIVVYRRVKWISDKDLGNWHYRKSIAISKLRDLAVQVGAKLYRLL